MFTRYRTEAFILKKLDRAEADQVLVIYTKDFGKIEVIAKGIRKISSKLRSGADLFYFSEIEFIQGRQYKILTDTLLIENFKDFKKSLAKLTIALNICQNLIELTPKEDSDQNIWKLVKEIFYLLKNQKKELAKFNLEIIYYYFLWNFLSLLGYCPEIYNCLFCRKKPKPEKLFFSAIEGGIVCQNCFKKLKLKTEINSEIVKILRIILEKKQSTLFRLKIGNNHFEFLAEISNNYLSQITNKNKQIKK